MNRTCFPAVAAAVLAFQFSGAFTSPSRAQSQALPSSLKWYAELAKQRGETSVHIGEILQPMAPRSPNQIAKQNAVVQGYVEATDVSSDGYRIFTWYRIRVEEQTAALEKVQKSAAVSERTPDTVAPSSLSGLHSDEILVRAAGGTALIDGVTITQAAQPLMALNQQYLLFLKPLGKSTYRYGYETEPIQVNQNGELQPFPSTSFSKQFQNFRSVTDVRNAVQ